MGAPSKTVQVALVCLMAAVVPVARGLEANAATRIASAATLMSLDLVDQKPWHLKLGVTIFDQDGKNPNQGTIEVWQAGADQRTVYTFGNSASTVVRHAGESHVVSSGSSLPLEVEEVQQQVLSTGPRVSDLSESTPEIRKRKFGTAQLECIMLTERFKGTEFAPLGLYPTYCLDADNLIRVSYSFGSHTVLFNGIGEFLGHKIPTQLEIQNDKAIIATAKVATLATYVPQPGDFLPAVDMKEAHGMVGISAGANSGHRLKFVQPVYPQTMKEQHMSGTVTMRAIIERDGHIFSLSPVNAANPDFVISAIAAVRQWTYTPYLLNGEPTAVVTTITVNFALSQ